MKTPTLEPAGPLLVPVDESGTAIGRPEPFSELEATRRIWDLESILRRLIAEALLYRDTGAGREHLTNAILDARRMLEGGAL